MQFHCYDDGKAPNLWQRWYDRAGGAIRGKHDSIWDHLETRPGNAWRMPQAKPLGGELFEVRIHGGVKWRVLGFFWPRIGEFTVVGICNHKDNVYDPKDAIKTAHKTIKAIKDGKAKIIACPRPQEDP